MKALMRPFAYSAAGACIGAIIIQFLPESASALSALEVPWLGALVGFNIGTGSQS